MEHCTFTILDSSTQNSFHNHVFDLKPLINLLIFDLHSISLIALKSSVKFSTSYIDLPV